MIWGPLGMLVQVRESFLEEVVFWLRLRLQMRQSQPCKDLEGEHSRQREQQVQRPCEGNVFHVQERHRPAWLKQTEGEETERRGVWGFREPEQEWPQGGKMYNQLSCMPQETRDLSKVSSLVFPNDTIRITISPSQGCARHQMRWLRSASQRRANSHPLITWAP